MHSFPQNCICVVFFKAETCKNWSFSKLYMLLRLDIVATTSNNNGDHDNIESVFSEIKSQDTSSKWFHIKKTGLWLADLFGLPIKGLVFWREKPLELHVLTRISEKTDFSTWVYFFHIIHSKTTYPIVFFLVTSFFSHFLLL